MPFQALLLHRIHQRVHVVAEHLLISGGGGAAAQGVGIELAVDADAGFARNAFHHARILDVFAKRGADALAADLAD